MDYKKMGDIQTWIETLERIVLEMQDVDDGELTVALEYVAQSVEELERV